MSWATVRYILMWTKGRNVWVSTRWETIFICKQYSLANNILSLKLYFTTSLVKIYLRVKYWNIIYFVRMYNFNVHVWFQRPNTTKTDQSSKSNFQIYKQDPVDNHTNKISLWRSNQKKIIGSCLILDLVHCSGSSFGRRRSRRRRHGEEALGQVEKAVERISLHIVEAEAGLHIEGTMRLEYKISTMIHEQHE